MTLDVRNELSADGVVGWAVGVDYAVGAYRLPPGRLAPERAMVEHHHCFGLSDTPSEVEVEGEDAAMIGPDILRFHNPGDRILSKTNPADACAENWIVVSPVLLETIFRESGGGLGGRSHRPFPRAFVRGTMPELAMLRAFFRRAEQGACQVWVEEAIVALLPRLLRVGGEEPASARPPSPRAYALARDADAFLVRNYAGELSLARLAAMLDVTPSHLARSYRSVMGHGMHARLTSLRLAAALRCLADGMTDITALGFELGYSSHSHFTAAFRRWLGAPPSAFRALCRSDQIFDSAARL